MKKVLFIIQSYPSNRSANVLCDEKIMKEMLKTGEYEIHCLVYRFHGQQTYEEINGLKIHRFRRSKWWDLYTYARDHESKTFYKCIVKLNRIYMRFRQLVCIPIYPNYEPVLARLAAKEAIELHKKENFDLVIAEHSGRDTLFGGMKLKEFAPNIKLISILWDPISGRDLAKYLPTKYAQQKIVVDELKLLGNSDRIICLASNRKFQEIHSSNKPFYNNIRFLDIPGIIAPNENRVTENYTKKGKINILYSGILSLPDRDPSIIIDIIKNSRFSSQINLLFFSAGIDGIEKAKKSLRDFNGDYLIHPYVPKNVLDSIAANSDILLNIGGPNPRMVPSKIFEYLSLCKPIISSYYIDNESSKGYFESYPLALCIDIRKPLGECVAQFESFIENRLNDTFEFESVRKLYPLNTPQKFIEVFEEVFEKE